MWELWAVGAHVCKPRPYFQHLICIHGSATILENVSWWPMNFSGSLWWTVKRTDFIVFDGGYAQDMGDSFLVIIQIFYALPHRQSILILYHIL